MTEKLETCSAADFRDKWGRVTPKSLMNGDSKTKQIGEWVVGICWSAVDSQYVVTAACPTSGGRATFDSIRSARAAFSAKCRELLAKQHQVECDATL